MKTALLLLMLGMLSCVTLAQVKRGGAEHKKISPTSNISIQAGDANELAFERIYRVRINANLIMKIRAHFFMDDTFRDGELTQSDGKWVTFEPEAPADKILDREILPAVQNACREIIKMDNDFRRNLPSEFTDNRGRRWRRMQ